MCRFGEITSESERKFERELRICDLARQILSFCHYRRTLNHLYYVRPASSHSVIGARREQTYCIVIDLAFSLNWYNEVYIGRLASVFGCFISEVVE